MSIRLAMPLNRLLLALGLLAMTAWLTGCSSTSIAPQSISNTVWQNSKNPHETKVFLPNGSFLRLFDGQLQNRGSWLIEGSNIEVHFAGYYTGKVVINTRTKERKRQQVADRTEIYWLNGDSLGYSNQSNWFFNDFYKRVDITAEKYVKDKVPGEIEEPTPTPLIIQQPPPVIIQQPTP